MATVDDFDEVVEQYHLALNELAARLRDGREKMAVSEQRSLRGTCPSSTRACNTSSAAPTL